LIAYDKVGSLYRGDFISGRATGSFFHWIIRTIYFIVMWAITYGVIWIGKFVVAHKIQIAIGICSIVTVVIAAKLFLWMKERNELVRVSVKVEENDNQ
jgi:cytosine/uracil/thiamine/allantoin permease